MGETVRVQAEPLRGREVRVEGTGFWGPDRALVARVERLGYEVEEHRMMATGDVWLEVK